MAPSLCHAHCRVVSWVDKGLGDGGVVAGAGVTAGAGVRAGAGAGSKIPET